ncbi:hypothetical protein JTE90_021381 [Oedothorax gibbosus]|uniref:Gustatory receptor n=1 Tax=Oedothorax gibbosus TaxID=931172 RepID=A0AAV6VE82_9ARAC|nr:hypothetical protein JTE90_021381 [Oedothorax gibbosus]
MAILKPVLDEIFFPIFATLTGLLYITICHRSSQALKKLTAEIETVQPAEFTLSTQKSLMRRVLVTEDFLNTCQKTFSVPSFLCFLAHFIWCSGFWSIAVTGFNSNMPMFVIYRLSFAALVSYSGLMTCLWFAGGVTLAMDDVKRAYSRKTQERFLVVPIEDELCVGRCLFERQSPVLSGCEVLHFTRNSILVVTGTLLTYTMLLLNIQS